MTCEVELVVEAQADVSVEVLASLTRQIQNDLRSDGRVAVTRKPAAAPDGARSGAAAQIGVLVVSGIFSATTVKAVRDVVLRRLARSSVTSARITWRADAEQGEFSVESQGLAPEELTGLVAAWNRGVGPGPTGGGRQPKEVERGPQAGTADSD